MSSEFPVIQCFYINIEKYFTVSLYRQNTLDLILSTVIDSTPISIGTDPWEHYLGSIHLKDEISVLAYMIDPMTADPNKLFYIQTKEVWYKNSNYELQEFFLQKTKIIINEEARYNYDNYYSLVFLKKITDYKFVFACVSPNTFGLYLYMFELYNFHNTNLIYRNYYIPLKMYNLKGEYFFKIFDFNRFTGIIFSYEDFNTDDEMNLKFFIISYIGSRDSTSLTIDQTSTIILSDYIDSTLIENNVFGLEFYGIKILKLPSITGLYYYSEITEKIIYENDILPTNDIIHFIFESNSFVTTEMYIIEMAGVLQEPSYSDFNQYSMFQVSFKKEFGQETFYKPRIFIGKTGFYNFTISSSFSTGTIYNCDTSKTNCKLCYSSNTCIKCNNGYYLKEDDNTCINTLIEGYYLDSYTISYKKCHEKCRTCSEGPIYYSDRLEYEDTKCDICITGYYLVKDTKNCSDPNNLADGYFLKIMKF